MGVGEDLVIAVFGERLKGSGIKSLANPFQDPGARSVGCRTPSEGAAQRKLRASGSGFAGPLLGCCENLSLLLFRFSKTIFQLCLSVWLQVSPKP